ncbi:MAG: UvrD-helicase domain-containing protein [Phycisphaerales bacterium]|nr:UvrD-helicase domain-containing protein [Phycisphaerales bacterium]
MPNNFELFDPYTIELKGSNLIEASAGTGKTFSITLLVVRLIIENNTTIEEILLVTFTKAATADLEIKVRTSIRQALQLARNENFKKYPDDPFAKVISNALNKAKNKEEKLSEIQERLQHADLCLDETAIMTIHGFCQKVLTEYAFETKQIFELQVVQKDDEADLLEDLANEVWRKYVTTIDKDILEKLLNDDTKFNKAYFHNIIKAIAIGKKIVGTDDSLLCKTNDINSKLLALIKRANHEDNVEIIIPDLLNILSSEVIDNFKQLKKYKGLISYDDMIALVHQSLFPPHTITTKLLEKEAHEKLIHALTTKYKAVFIDEFQDTDKLQYEVFKKIFCTNNDSKNILFYIGDPKQSIYSFRKADIYTYMKAVDEVDHRFFMNVNYRSNEQLLKAINKFFKPTEHFNTFNSQPTINQALNFDYQHVDSPTPNKQYVLLQHEKPVAPFVISQNNKNKNIIADQVLSTIINLLNPNNCYYLKNPNEPGRPVLPSDIAIIVRNNNEGHDLKKKLAKYKLPAITVDDSKILETEEAKEILYILEALIDTRLGNIYRALCTKIMGHNNQDLKTKNPDTLLEQFLDYQNSWSKKGVFPTLKSLLANYQVANNIAQNNEYGDRVMTNIYHLLEILHKQEKIKKYTQNELVHWFGKAIEGEKVEGDEYEQRLERDDDAIKIVTIHKSKGLEYNIVLAPYLDLKPIKRRKLLAFRDGTNSVYYIVDKNILTPSQEEIWRTQEEQENRRLIYVAITRAKAQCFLFSTMKGGFLEEALPALNRDANLVDSGITQWGMQLFKNEELKNYQYTPPKQENNETVQYATMPDYKLLQPKWCKLSYTFLTVHSENKSISSKIENTNAHATTKNDYDHFVFEELKRGAQIGIMFHEITEAINWQDSKNWEYAIKKILKRKSITERIGGNEEKIISLLTEISETTIPIKDSNPNIEPFQFKDIDNATKITELEFNIPVKAFQTERWQQLAEMYNLNLRNLEVEGILNGKIDLFFKVNNRYYILDWKTDYLGNQVSDYTTNNISKAMSDSNYYLQCLIYTIAIKKYLTHCIPNFDYEQDFGGVIYAYIRGIRKNGKTGLLINKPDKLVINAMSDEIN